MKQPAILRQCL